MKHQITDCVGENCDSGAALIWWTVCSLSWSWIPN